MQNEGEREDLLVFSESLYKCHSRAVGSSVYNCNIQPRRSLLFAERNEGICSHKYLSGVCDSSKL